jgi:hypothetical protein
LVSFSHGQLNFLPFDPVHFVTTSVVVVSIVKGRPGPAYVRRRVASTAVKKLTSVLLVFVAGDWTVLYSFLFLFLF